MSEKLNDGQLTRHYRPAGTRRIACGVRHGVVTAVANEVGCKPCRKVQALMIELSDRCGCREPVVHMGHARWYAESRGDLA